MKPRHGVLTLALGWLLLTLGSGSVWGAALTSAEKRKIEALIAGVEQMTDAFFVRNGKQYPAEAAAEFLRRKWKSRRSEVRSAADFIDKVASFSSTTGKPYSIRWSDGRERLSAEFFRAQLALLDKAVGDKSS
jgi:hypothetical protein